MTRQLHDVPTTFDMMASSQPQLARWCLPPSWQSVPDRWMMVAALSGTRNSANYHSQPVDRLRPGTRGLRSVPVVRPPARVSEGPRRPWTPGGQCVLYFDWHPTPLGSLWSAWQRN